MPALVRREDRGKERLRNKRGKDGSRKSRTREGERRGEGDGERLRKGCFRNDSISKVEAEGENERA